MKFGVAARLKKSANVNKPKVGAVILSRFSSSRLPGKALRQIEGKEILKYIVERLMVCMKLEDIVIATSIEKSDDPIAEFAKVINVNCYRGSLDNVAERFFEAAAANDWDYAMRINGDNIFVDMNVVSEMIHIAQSGKYSFISNVKNRTFPKGMSVEIVSKPYFQKLLPTISASESYKEHVTLYLYDNEEREAFHYHYNTALPEASGLQFALDTKEDFERTEKIIGQFKGNHTQYNLHEIFEIYQNVT